MVALEDRMTMALVFRMLTLTALMTSCVVEPASEDDGAGGSEKVAGSSNASSSASSGAAASGGTGSGGSTGCSSHSQCGGDEICLGGNCQTAWNRLFRYSVVAGEAPTTNPNDMGASWDVGGGAPDPFVEIREGETIIEVTSVQYNTFFPVWGEYAEVVLKQGGADIAFVMFDEDTVDHDYMTGVTAKPESWLSTVQTANGDFTWTQDGVSLTLKITPQ